MLETVATNDREGFVKTIMMSAVAETGKLQLVMFMYINFRFIYVLKIPYKCVQLVLSQTSLFPHGQCRKRSTSNYKM